ncbi:hypothetical protein JCM11491_000217 [Sporobolomyces phaffii]
MSTSTNSSSNSPSSSSASSPTGRSFPSTAFSITIPPSQLSADAERDSPRRKRHASLDAGHFRYRSISSRDSSVYISPASTPYDEKIKAFDFSSKAPLVPSPFEPRKKPMNRKWLRACSGLLGLLLLGIMARRAGARDDWWTAKNSLDSVLTRKSPSCDNPYSELGRIAVDQKVPENNRWKPYDSTCAPPPLLATLRKALRTKTRGDKEPAPLSFPLPRRKPATSALPLPWLQGKTVLLFGDHVERNHNKDFCRFAGGQFATIGRDHELSPPRFVNGIDEKLPEKEQENSDASRPAVCYIPEYDFTILSVFHYGLVNRVEIERESLLEEPTFYPPVALEDRLTHIILPILDSLNRTQPDLIEFSTGFWDLRHFTALDEQEGVDPFTELSSERLTWYSERLTRAFADLADVFPRTPLLWRALHQTPEHKGTPPARVAALDALGRKVVAFLNTSPTVGDARDKIAELIETEESDSRPVKRHGNGARVGGMRRKTYRERGSSKARFLNKVKQRIGSSERLHDVIFGSDSTTLKGMITVDEWGTLMRGQEHLMNKIHTPSLPGGYLWGDMMLFFLERLSSAPHFRP